jgi:hypothetical protein
MRAYRGAHEISKATTEQDLLHKVFKSPFPHIPTRGAERMNVELTKEDVFKIRKMASLSSSRPVSNDRIVSLCLLALEALERREQSKGSAEEVSANIEKLWLDTPCLGDPYRRLAAQRESAGIIQDYADRCVKESRGEHP